MDTVPCNVDWSGVLTAMERIDSRIWEDFADVNSRGVECELSFMSRSKALTQNKAAKPF